MSVQHLFCMVTQAGCERTSLSSDTRCKPDANITQILDGELAGVHGVQKTLGRYEVTGEVGVRQCACSAVCMSRFCKLTAAACAWICSQLCDES